MKSPPVLVFDETDLRILALTVYGEARGETFAGKIAVAYVVRNRVLDRRWPDKVADVCRQPKQFSCWNKGEANNWPMLQADLSDRVFQECYAAAASVLAGVVRDGTLGSTHYHTLAVKPSWAEGRASAGAIGHHVFYNDIE